MRIATVNVNGIRAAVRRGMNDWLSECQPDVLALQEVRASTQILVDLLPGWQVVHQEAAQAGRAGVAVAVRQGAAAVTASRLGLDTGVPGDDGRWVEADLRTRNGAQITVVSVYLHSATVDHPSLPAKYAFMDRVQTRLHDLRDGTALVTGDLNIAHHQDDLKNWKGNRGKAGFLEEERAYLDRWFGDDGWTDVTRVQHGPGPGPYTWWSWRGKAFDNDAGWRIDYHMASAQLASTVTGARIFRAPSYDARFSDHAPVIVDYDI